MFPNRYICVYKEETLLFPNRADVNFLGEKKSRRRCKYSLYDIQNEKYNFTMEKFPFAKFNSSSLKFKSYTYRKEVFLYSKLKQHRQKLTEIHS